MSTLNTTSAAPSAEGPAQVYVVVSDRPMTTEEWERACVRPE